MLTKELYTKLYNDITEFRNAFDLPTELPIEFMMEDKSAPTLHLNLFLEEFLELQEATTLEERIDALVDMAYIFMGYQVHRGETVPSGSTEEMILNMLLKSFPSLELFLECWDEVHAANMSKLSKTEMDAKLTQEHYANKGIETYYTPKGDFFVTKVKYHVEVGNKIYPEGKVLKDINWNEPNLVQFLELEELAAGTTEVNAGNTL